MRLFFATLLAASLTCGSLAGAPIPADRAMAIKVIGTWKLVRSSKGSEQQVRLEVEFTASGKMLIRQAARNGAPMVLAEGKYKVKDGSIPYTVSTNGVERGETLTIKKLTATELIVEDPDGIREEFERVKPPKQGEK